MKHLANCTTDEFAQQAIRMKAGFAEWLELLGAGKIRQKYAGKLAEDADEKAKLQVMNAFAGEILGAALEKAPELTMALLCLSIFTDDFNDHTIREYIAAAVEMYSDSGVRNFFTLILVPLKES